MLTNLDFLNTRSMWPPKGEQKRLKRYQDNKLLFEGEHTQVFREIWMRLFRNEYQLSIEIVLNWPRRLSTLWADLLFGETPELSDAKIADNADYLQEIAKDTKLWARAYTAALDCSRFGDTILKARRTESGDVKISVIPPCYWFPVVSEDDAQEVQYHVLAWPSAGYNEEQHSSKLYVEIHSKDETVYRTYRMPKNYPHTGNGTIGLVEEERTEPNTTGRFYVVHIANLRVSDSIYGVDDYDDLTSVMQEIEVRFAQIARVLDRHADPKMYGPEDTIGTDENTGKTFVKAGDYFPLDSADSVVPAYITWDGRLDMSFKQIEELMKQFYMLSETSPAVFGEIKSGLAESGSALKRLLMAPLAKVNRVRLGFDDGLCELLKVMTLLDGRNNVDPEIDWQDGLPDDESELTTIEATAVTAGISSKKSAMKRRWKMSDKQADEELAQIEQESPRVIDPYNPFAKEDGSNAGN